MAYDFLTQIDMNNLKIVNVATPTADADAATKAYVDSHMVDSIGALDYKGTLDASLLGTQLDNGEKGDFYVVNVAGTILSTLELAVGDMVFLNKDVTGTPTIDDLDKIDNTDLSEADVRALVSASGAISYNNSTGVFTLVVDGTSIQQTGDTLSIVAGGVGTTELADDSVTKAKLGNDVAGTGITQEADGSLSVTAPKLKYAEDIGGAEDITVTHNLGSEDLVFSVRALSDGDFVTPKVSVTDSNSVTVHFDIAPPANSYRIVLLG